MVALEPGVTFPVILLTIGITSCPGHHPARLNVHVPLWLEQILEAQFVFHKK